MQSQSLILTLPHSKGHMMSQKCEQPFDELSVQVWSPYIYIYPNSKYCTLYVSRSELSKTEVPRDVRNSKVREQDKFLRDWSQRKTHASPKVGQDQVSGGESVLCWHAAPVANVLWKPGTIR